MAVITVHRREGKTHTHVPTFRATCRHIPFNRRGILDHPHISVGTENQHHSNEKEVADLKKGKPHTHVYRSASEIKAACSQHVHVQPHTEFNPLPTTLVLTYFGREDVRYENREQVTETPEGGKLKLEDQLYHVTQ